MKGNFDEHRLHLQGREQRLLHPRMDAAGEIMTVAGVPRAQDSLPRPTQSVSHDLT
jgi:hypothetical protein